MTDQTIKKRNYKGWIISICLTAIAILLISSNWYWLRANYSNLTRNHFKPGQKVYAIPFIFDANPKFSSIGILRMIRPINELDIDLMKIPEAQKTTMRNKLNQSLKPCLIFTYKMFTATDLKQVKSSFVGYYISHKIYDLMGTNVDLTKGSYCEIKPNTALIHDHSESFKMPNNYTWADSKYYLSTENIADDELPSFVR